MVGIKGEQPTCCGKYMHDVNEGSGPVRHWFCFTCRHEAPQAASYVF